MTKAKSKRKTEHETENGATNSKQLWADILGTKGIRFAVLYKNNRFMVLHNPSTRQLRRRGRRQWYIHGIVQRDSNSQEQLDTLVQQCVERLQPAGAKAQTA